jgi:TolB protein
LKKIDLQVFLISLLLCAGVSAAELNIEITRGVDNPIAVAVVPFGFDGAGTPEEDVARVIANNLEQVGEFRALSRANMLSMPRQESEVHYRDWRILAQQYLVVGNINQAPGSQSVQVQWEFFDVIRE